MKYDIVIVGGGMAGAALAAALAQSSYRIALIDAAPQAVLDDARLIALTASSCTLLDNLGVWDSLKSHATPIKQIHVSQRGKFGITRIHANELQLENLGHLVPAKYINHALDKKIKTLPQVTVLRSAKLTALQKEKTYTLTVKTHHGNEQLECELLIAADGSHSTVRELLHIPTTTTDYEQSAIVTITELQRSHQNIAYERFREHGAIAMLPLGETQCATIWTDTNANVSQLLALSDDDFLHTLQKEFGYRLGRFKKTLQRHHYPLKLILAEKSQHDNAILLGNAAHTMHPIAAQGLNLTFYEIAKLTEYLISHNTLQLPSTPLLDLKPWSVQLSHQLTWLFANNSFLFTWARQIGMLGLDNCTIGKKFFIQKSLGKMGVIPTLLQEKEPHEHHYNESGTTAN